MTWFVILQCHVDDNKMVMGYLLLSSDHIRFFPSWKSYDTGHCKGRHCKFSLTAVIRKLVNYYLDHSIKVHLINLALTCQENTETESFF